MTKQIPTYDTFHTSQLQNAQRGLTRRHGTKIRKVLKDVQTVLLQKGKDYNNLSTMIEHMPFGDKSWATMLWIKAHRVASVMEAGDTHHEALDDSILDLAAYAVAYLAWRQIKHDEAETLRHSTNEVQHSSDAEESTIPTGTGPTSTSKSGRPSVSSQLRDPG